MIRFRATHCRIGAPDPITKEQEIWCRTAPGMGGPHRVVIVVGGRTIFTPLEVAYQPPSLIAVSPSVLPTEAAGVERIALKGEGIAYSGMQANQVSACRCQSVSRLSANDVI